jgi:hypothetical protein
MIVVYAIGMMYVMFLVKEHVDSRRDFLAKKGTHTQHIIGRLIVCDVD